MAWKSYNSVDFFVLARSVQLPASNAVIKSLNLFEGHDDLLSNINVEYLHTKYEILSSNYLLQKNGYEQPKDYDSRYADNKLQKIPNLKMFVFRIKNRFYLKARNLVNTVYSSMYGPKHTPGTIIVYIFSN